jgi:hypothetical protein
LKVTHRIQTVAALTETATHPKAVAFRTSGAASSALSRPLVLCVSGHHQR